MNTKSETMILENVVFILFIIVFVVAVGLSIVRFGSYAALYEEVYAKQIALLIDRAKPGMEIEMNIAQLEDLAKKNHYTGEIIRINNSDNSVRVKLEEKGYTHYFFSNNTVVWNIDEKKNILMMRAYDGGDNV